MDQKKTPTFLTKKITRKGTVWKKLQIIFKNFYFLFLCEQFSWILLIVTDISTTSKSKRIPPPINLLLGKQSSNSTIFAVKISLNRYRKQRRKQLTGTTEVRWIQINDQTRWRPLHICFSSSSFRYNSMETLEKLGDILKMNIVSNFTCAKPIPKQCLLCKLVAFIISRKNNIWRFCLWNSAIPKKFLSSAQNVKITRKHKYKGKNEKGSTPFNNSCGTFKRMFLFDKRFHFLVLHDSSGLNTSAK